MKIGTGKRRVAAPKASHAHNFAFSLADLRFAGEHRFRGSRWQTLPWSEASESGSNLQVGFVCSNRLEGRCDASALSPVSRCRCSGTLRRGLLLGDVLPNTSENMAEALNLTLTRGDLSRGRLPATRRSHL